MMLKRKETAVLSVERKEALNAFFDWEAGKIEESEAKPIIDDFNEKFLDMGAEKAFCIAYPRS
ncbi:MAG: hypothetical protein B6I30_09555 [Desulfobacteraceae bacterium 4572_187]|nr:MAG: hypothetical protein B6I30_09555 [Desulfobacteraceae bacterium 4572_187]